MTTHTRVRVAFGVALSLLSLCLLAQPVAAGPGNDTAATATPVTMGGGRLGGGGGMFTSTADEEWWTFTAPVDGYVSIRAHSVQQFTMTLFAQPLVNPRNLNELERAEGVQDVVIAGRYVGRSRVFVRLQLKPGQAAVYYGMGIAVTVGEPYRFAYPWSEHQLQLGRRDLLMPGRLMGWLGGTLAPGGEDITFVINDNAPTGRFELWFDPSPMIDFGSGPARSSTRVAPRMECVLPGGGVVPLPSPTCEGGIAGDYLIRVKAVDANGAPVSGPFRILVARTNPPPSGSGNLSVVLAQTTTPELERAFSRVYRVENTSATRMSGYQFRTGVRNYQSHSAQSFEASTATCTHPPVGGSGEVACSLVQVNSGGAVIITVTDVPFPFPHNAGLLYDTRAAILPTTATATEGPDVQLEDDEARRFIPFAPLSDDLSISAPRTFTGQESRRYNLAIRNQGALDSLAQTVKISLPAGVDFNAVPPMAGAGISCQTSSSLPRTSTCRMSTALLVGQSRTVPIEFGRLTSLPAFAGVVRFEVSSDRAEATPADNVALDDLAVLPVITATDADGDGLPNAFEEAYGLNANEFGGQDGALGDPDGDGVSNLEELRNGTHPRGFHRRYFAEGSTGAFFDERLAILTGVAPMGVRHHLQLRFLRPGGPPITQALQLDSSQRATIDPEIIPGLESTAVSTVIESDLPFVADRTMSWQADGYGGHAETGVEAPATTWYFAEGSTVGRFSLFYLLQNPNGTPANVTVRYLRPAPALPITKSYAVPANTRQNIWVNTEGPELAATDVSAVVTSDVPIIAERAMYLDTPGQPFGAGHDSVGVTAPSTSWFLAEGATGPYFDLFVLLANPSDQEATVDLRFLKPDGTVIARSRTLAPNTRSTVWVDGEDPVLSDTAVSTTVQSTNGVGILVERAMWWPGTVATWFEAHDSAGATETGTRWEMAEGEVGGPRDVSTFVLVANTAATSANIAVVLYFEDGTSTDGHQFTVPADARFNVDVGAEFPEARGRRFGVSVASDGQPIVVERAMYWNADGVTWAAGTNALATRVP